MTNLVIYDQIHQIYPTCKPDGKVLTSAVSSEDAFYGSRPAVETKDSNRNGLVFHWL